MLRVVRAWAVSVLWLNVCLVGCSPVTRATPDDRAPPPDGLQSTVLDASGSRPADVTAVLSGAPLVRSEPVSFAPIVHAADPSVVTITTVSSEVEISPFSHMRRPREARGLGTGFVVDKAGTIVTNNHVVAEADEIVVKLSDEREFPGKVVGTDPPTDIAVVRIAATDLRPLPLGDSDTIEIGDWVVAIGNPFNLSHTVSAGIVSAKGRTRDDVPLDPAGYYNFLQTDASINPGNSGGPLLNLKGEVVGMNSAIRGGGAQGIGFAIPINMMKQLLPMLLRDGHVTRSALGINIVDARKLSVEERSALKLGTGSRVMGAVIEYVAPSGPGARAGLRPGDTIVAFDGQSIGRSEELQWLASTAGVGRQVALTVLRQGSSVEIKATLGRLADQMPGPR